MYDFMESVEILVLKLVNFVVQVYMKIREYERSRIYFDF